jgi:hypothetical protein
MVIQVGGLAAGDSLLRKRMILRWTARSSRSKSLLALSRNLTFQVKTAGHLFE